MATETAERGMLLDGAGAAGLDPDGLRRAFGLLQGWIDEGVLPAAAALVARGGKIAGEAYLGLADSGSGRPADSDTIWSLASITKPFTATAAMLLVERGLLSLDERLVDLLPEFADGQASPFDRRLVSLRHALGHSSGLPGFSPDNIALRKAHRPLEDFVRSFGRQPLLYEPGSHYYYSNPGILMAAESVARTVDGTLGKRLETPAIRRYHDVVHGEILAPLGMSSSSMLPSAEWAGRIARIERTGQEGTDYEISNSAYYRSLGIPWGGLFSRPRELARFVDLFLPAAGGVQRIGAAASGGVRLVSAATARQMTSVQFAPPEAPHDLRPELRDHAGDIVPMARVEWGVGWEIKGGKHRHRNGELTSAASYGHAGATGTMVWADPDLDVTLVLLTNRTLASGWTTERPRQAMFSNAVVAATR